MAGLPEKLRDIYDKVARRNPGETNSTKPRSAWSE
jgi:hypothetical protein